MHCFYNSQLSSSLVTCHLMLTINRHITKWCNHIYIMYIQYGIYMIYILYYTWRYADESDCSIPEGWVRNPAAHAGRT